MLYFFVNKISTEFISIYFWLRDLGVAMLNSNNIFLVGLMGSGKTSIGQYLAKQLNLNFIDADQELEQRTGVTVSWIFSIEGEEGFRKRETKIIDELTQRQNIVLATGGGAILNPFNRTILAQRGLVIYLQASIEQLVQRTSANRNRPLLQEKDPHLILTKLLEQREVLYQEIADLTINTDSSNIIQIANDIISELKNKSLFALNTS